MQKLIVTLLLVAALALAESARLRRDDDKYTDKYDNVDIDEILGSDRLVNNYANCLLDKGKCTPDAAELKANLGDALQKDCSKCSKKQKDAAEKVIKHLHNEKPDIWKELTAKYDPDNVYVTKYGDRLKKITS